MLLVRCECRRPFARRTRFCVGAEGHHPVRAAFDADLRELFGAGEAPGVGRPASVLSGARDQSVVGRRSRCRPRSSVTYFRLTHPERRIPAHATPHIGNPLLGLCSSGAKTRIPIDRPSMSSIVRRPAIGCRRKNRSKRSLRTTQLRYPIMRRRRQFSQHRPSQCRIRQKRSTARERSPALATDDEQASQAVPPSLLPSRKAALVSVGRCDRPAVAWCAVAIVGSAGCGGTRGRGRVGA
jgi:hypothetical protein